MICIDEARLETDLAYRFRYLADFIEFDQADVAEVLALGPLLGPMIPHIVEKTYERLLAYDATARHFVPRQSGFVGEVPPNLGAVSGGHPQIQFRKEHLSRYFMQVLGRNCDERLAPYLDMVGKIHTRAAGNSSILVPLVQMNALMGFLADVLIELIASLPLDAAAMARSIRAFSKLLWIQNDFIARHYQTPSPASPAR